jgi:hypothetical protein
MQIIKLILMITFTFLLATGIQGLVLIIIGCNVFNFTAYSLFGWIVQIVYFTIAICIGVLWWNDECN